MFESDRAPMVISGCVGPRGDGYKVENAMTAGQAQAYHAGQIDVFAETAADMVTAITMTYADEAIGITRAAQAAGMPVVIRSEEHTSELQSLMRISYAVFRLKKKNNSRIYYTVSNLYLILRTQ